MKTFLLFFLVVVHVNQSISQRKISNGISETHVMVQGTTIHMVPPQDFTMAVNFSGFQQDESGSSIMVLDLPAPFSEISSAFSAEALLSKGMDLLANEELVLNGLPAFLLAVEQEAYGQTYKKYILAFGNDRETVMINGTFPKGKELMGDAIKNALLTTVYDADKKIDPFDNVEFEISTEGTALIFAKSMSNSLIFSKDERLPSQSEDQANFIVGKAFSEVIVTDKEQFAITRLGQLPIAIDSIISTAAVEIDGLSGIEIIADGEDPKKGHKEKIYQTILFEDTLYFIMVGSCEGNFEENIAMFQNITKTFKRK